MDKFLESVRESDFDRRISEVVEMLEEKQLYGTISLIKDLKYHLDLAVEEKVSCNCQHNSEPRDNEPCCRCDSRIANINKAKVDSLEIITQMLDGKPYYELKYRLVGKNDYSIGYSSCDLKIVLDYIDTYFEIVKNDRKTNADRIRSMSDEELAEFMSENTSYYYCGVQCKDRPNSPTESSCNFRWLDWLQSEAE